MSLEKELHELARKAVYESAALRSRYRERFEVGSIAEDWWDRSTEFGLGIEYGILIAIHEILEARGLVDAALASGVFVAKVKPGA